MIAPPKRDQPQGDQKNAAKTATIQTRARHSPFQSISDRLQTQPDIWLTRQIVAYPSTRKMAQRRRRNLRATTAGPPVLADRRR